VAGSLAGPARASQPPPFAASVKLPGISPASTYREVTRRYFFHLYRETGGRLPEIARRAGISKTTAYEWREKFGTPDAPRESAQRPMGEEEVN